MRKEGGGTGDVDLDFSGVELAVVFGLFEGGDDEVDNDFVFVAEELANTFGDPGYYDSHFDL